MGCVTWPAGPKSLAASYGSSCVSVLLANGPGTFAAASNVALGLRPIAVAIGDLDSDGVPDIVTASPVTFPGTVSVLLGNGAGGFAPGANASVGNYPTCVAIADVNGDGKLDVVTANSGGNPGTATVLLGDGNGGFSSSTPVVAGLGARSVAIGDVNGDGAPDLAVANGQGNTISILLGNGAGSFALAANYEASTVPAGVALADVNGDGKPDLLSAAYYTNNVSLRLGNGLGVFGAKTTFAVGRHPTALALGDLDGDGKLDVATADSNTATVTVLINQRHLPAPTAYCTAGTTTHGCAAVLSGSGVPSASASSGFALTATQVEGQKSGLIFYGVSGREALPWSPTSTSYLCVRPPTQRSAFTNPGGTIGLCDGVFVLDFNQYRYEHPSALGQPMLAGQVIDAQAWFRDPPASKTTNLSAGLEFTLAP